VIYTTVSLQGRHFQARHHLDDLVHLLNEPLLVHAPTWWSWPGRTSPGPVTPGIRLDFSWRRDRSLWSQCAAQRKLPLVTVQGDPGVVRLDVPLVHLEFLLLGLLDLLVLRALPLMPHKAALRTFLVHRTRLPERPSSHHTHTHTPQIERSSSSSWRASQGSRRACRPVGEDSSSTLPVSS